MVKTLMLSSLIMVAGSAVAADFKVSSPELQSGRFGEAQVMSGFGCSGDNISPSISWSGEPEGTQSFALSIYDRDAPTLALGGGGYPGRCP